VGNISPAILKAACARQKASHTQLALLPGNTSITGQPVLLLVNESLSALMQEWL